MERCDGVTKGRKWRIGQPGRCRRRARWSLELTDGRIVSYCQAHRDGAGIMKMLLPFPWEIRTEVALRGEDL